MSKKETAWLAYREAWNTKGSMDELTDLEERTARKHFESWWEVNRHE